MSIPRFTAMKVARTEESNKFADKCTEKWQGFNKKSSTFIQSVSPGSSPSQSFKFNYYMKKADSNLNATSSLLKNGGSWMSPQWSGSNA